MCGIVGKINFDPERLVSPEQIRLMAESVKHRGPDDDGIWVKRNVGLGHRRLSIIDLSADGRNPMSNEDATVWIVFNGEIYNFLELRPGLEAAGYKFKSRTDTEVVLHLYEQYGCDCVKYLRGMFAFAIWDSRLQQLFLTRDRLGVKPLYYAVSPSGLIFGSEIKALLSTGEIDGLTDASSIHQFLLWQCIPSPKTAFQGIKKLPPASVLTWKTEAGISVNKYWELNCTQPLTSSRREIAAEVRSLVQEATRIRQIADVPVGIFLSGGIDSACVLAAARKGTAGRIQTFSATFGHKNYDESQYARQLARHFETDHEEFHVSPQVIEALPRMAALFDEPFGDVASIPTYYLASLTSRHVKVALSGDGGDEAFGGYQRYLAFKALALVGRLPGKRALSKLRHLLPYNSNERSKLRYLRELLTIVGSQPGEQYKAIFLGMHDADEWLSLYSEPFRQSLSHPETGASLSCWDELSAPDELARAMLFDTRYYIPECLNVKVDVCSMACGLEVRSPFLDHKLVEFCARIPTPMKIRGWNQKSILKEAFEQELPAEVLSRGKAGFGLPLADWFRHELRDSAREILLSSRSKALDIFNKNNLTRMLDEHAARKRNWHIQLWRILVLENWLQATAIRAQSVMAYTYAD
jgi:asparagine synthase (glutamine-hydrolysing)